MLAESVHSQSFPLKLLCTSKNPIQLELEQFCLEENPSGLDVPSL
jgi:hypothetical protein